MRVTRLALLATFVVLALTLFQTGISAGYQLGWTSIQHRVTESGATINRLAFEILDDSGNYVDSAGVVTNAILRPPQPNGDPDPGGIPVNLTTLNFSPLFDFYGSRFNTTNSAWEYSTPIQISDFNANILDPLIIGTYILEVTMDSGPTLIEQIEFGFLLDLPVISSRTFQIHTDSAGNLHWSWDVPKDLLALAQTYDLQIRAGVGAIDNGVLVALYWPNVPVEMCSSFAPSTIYQDLISRSDQIEFYFQVRTSNNFARAYSNTIVVKDISSPVSIFPKMGTVVIPLF